MAIALGTKLATFGGAPGGRGPGGGGREPGSILAFTAINSTFNTVLGPISQNGIDMPLTPALIHTWESGCKEITATEGAWRFTVRYRPDRLQRPAHKEQPDATEDRSDGSGGVHLCLARSEDGTC